MLVEKDCRVSVKYQQDSSSFSFYQHKDLEQKMPDYVMANDTMIIQSTEECPQWDCYNITAPVEEL